MSPRTGTRDAPRGAKQVGRNLETVRVRLLCGFQVSASGRTIGENEWRRRKAANLIKLLALAPGHRLHRERVMDLLWPDLGMRSASNNLRVALHSARRTLDPDPTATSHYLELQSDQLVLCPSGQLWVDVDALEEAAATARRSRDPAAYRAAIELYAGELLPEDRYEEWAEVRREELRRLQLSLLVEVAALHEERAAYGSAIEALKKVEAEEPTFEEAHVGLMRLFALSGWRGEALSQYERLEKTLTEQFGTKPGEASQRLFKDIAAGKFPVAHRPGSAIAPREALPSTSRNNLPAERTSFIGRERELLEVKRELAMTRMLTLMGTGGAGKTRLGLEVARDLIGVYPDGIWLVELASLSEPALVSQAVAVACGVLEQPGQPLVEALVAALRNKQLLLVLDNCEHLIAACARLVDTVLDACPRIRILATSREALGVEGETRWPVSPLPVPVALRPLSARELERFESARLFVERARHHDPTFALTDQNAEAVAEVCLKLEGIPLAIELAAVRVGVLSVEQIARRLEDSLRLLTGGARMVPPKQRTLRGALDWSYELLSEPERKLFARLSVFAGGWSLEAAEAVGPGDGIKVGEVLDLISRLADKSLVVTEATGKSGMRHGMLEPVRQYARERLEERKEREVMQRNHAAFFLTLAEEAEPELLGPEQTTWLECLETEHDNLRAALSWSLGNEETLGLRLVGALSRFWYIRGYLSEGRRWLEEGLTVGSVLSSPVRAKALGGAGWLAEAQGDYERARAAHEESLKIYRGLGDNKGIASSLANLGRVALSQGDQERASEQLEESLAVLRKSRNDRDLARVLTSLGIMALSKGDHMRAGTFFEEALSLLRDAGDVRGVAVSLNNLGFAMLYRGDGERAMALFEEARARNLDIGDAQGIATSLINMGLAALTTNQIERAAKLLQDSLVMLQEVQSKQTMVECLEAMAALAGAQGQARRSARLWGATQTVRENMGAPLPSDESAILEPHLTAARGQLDDEEWEAVCAEGKAMRLEEAVEYALAVEVSASSMDHTINQQPAGTHVAALTRREEEIAAIAARGLTNRQIGVQLSVSEHTVATHISRILKKLGLHSRAQLGSWLTKQQSTS
jgi:predicted ATPase/DNA-binding SARP family transcriptional activator/DNA-binding CsgD family transcriptional regulator/Tfp pilus assembly protein PilF